MKLQPLKKLQKLNRKGGMLNSSTGPPSLHHVAHLLDNFGLFCDAEIRNVGGMSGIFPSCSEEEKRIRPEKPVIKDGIFPSTSR
jgi:hypothetical protein